MRRLSPSNYVVLKKFRCLLDTGYKLSLAKAHKRCLYKECYKFYAAGNRFEFDLFYCLHVQPTINNENCLCVWNQMPQFYGHTL